MRGAPDRLPRGLPIRSGVKALPGSRELGLMGPQHCRCAGWDVWDGQVAVIGAGGAEPDGFCVLGAGLSHNPDGMSS